MPVIRRTLVSFSSTFKYNKRKINIALLCLQSAAGGSHVLLSVGSAVICTFHCHLSTRLTWLSTVPWGGLGHLGSTYTTQAPVSVCVDCYSYVSEVMWAPLCKLWKVGPYRAMTMEEWIYRCWFLYMLVLLCWESETCRMAYSMYLLRVQTALKFPDPPFYIDLHY